MTATFMVRIQILEKKLDEYQTRLDLEEKRRIILEKWIHLNFNFDVSSELKITKHLNDQPIPVTPGNRNRIMRGKVRPTRSCDVIDRDYIDPLIPSDENSSVGGPNNNQIPLVEEIDPLEITIDQVDHGVDGERDNDNFIPASQSDDSDSDRGIKKKLKVKRSQGNRSIHIGRKKGLVWKHFRTVPNPVCPKVVDAFCLKCGIRVSAESPRLKRHLRKCKGSSSQTATQIPNPIEQLNSAMVSIGAETIQPSYQNNLHFKPQDFSAHTPSVQVPAIMSGVKE